MIELLAWMFLAIACGEFVAWFGIITRHGIPSSPLWFHVVLSIPMLTGVASSLALSYVALAPAHPDGIALMLLAVYFLSQLIFWWLMNIAWILTSWRTWPRRD